MSKDESFEEHNLEDTGAQRQYIGFASTAQGNNSFSTEKKWTLDAVGKIKAGYSSRLNIDGKMTSLL